MHKKPNANKMTMPDAQCSTCFFYNEGLCQIHSCEVKDQGCCNHYQFDALCVDCGGELGEAFAKIEDLLLCQCVCCGSITVGPAGVKGMEH